MKKTRLALICLLINTTCWARIQLTLDNKTSKPIDFVLDVPRTTLHSKFNQAPAHSRNSFDYESVHSTCIKKHWRCTKFEVRIEKWGGKTVFFTCPKQWTPRVKHQRKLHFKITGNDISNLKCTQIYKKRH